MTDSRAKGGRGERLFARAWNALFDRGRARRGQQYCGANGDPDVTGIRGAHPEVKFYAKHAAIRIWRQAKRDAKPGAVPFGVLRENGDPEFYLLFALSDMEAVARIVANETGRPVYPEDRVSSGNPGEPK